MHIGMQTAPRKASGRLLPFVIALTLFPCLAFLTYRSKETFSAIVTPLWTPSKSPLSNPHTGIHLGDVIDTPFGIPETTPSHLDHVDPFSPPDLSHSPPATPRPGSSKYTVKPIAYIFPQYYPIPENDIIWGENFTEWNNVLKVSKNAYGMSTIRPAPSVGYYNGLDFSTRKRQGEFLRESGFYGAVFHHYWFSGKPVMDGIIQAMLKDGQPNIPFMISWANEPWTARWDGLDSSEIFIAQEYGGVDAWRAHFDWLLPFFKHPLYIRSEGRVQFLVYKPSHLGDKGAHMFAAWRQWAEEEGLVGLDVVETYWSGYRWNNAVPDAVNEFAPHTAGLDHATQSQTRRVSRVYHRGMHVCWDATPRKGVRAGNPQPFCHPTSWKSYVLTMLQQIKEEPNPVGAENFLFVNALNEWGEGNALEPSVQFGDGYGKAMKSALQLSEQLHFWPDELLNRALLRTSSEKAQPKLNLDVCVLARMSSYDASSFDDLKAMLRSLQAQENERWRAIVFNDTSESGIPSLEDVVLRMVEPRIQWLDVPREDVKERSEPFTNTDWLISQLSTMACGGAKYLLITEGDQLYHPSAFNTASTGEHSLLGLNVESRLGLWNLEDQSGINWEDRCVRLEVSSCNLP
jgi:Glycosyltransferase WbsX